MLRIGVVVGARPNFIKLAPLLGKLERHNKVKVIHTGQHYSYNMDKLLFEQLGLRDPDYNLGVGSGSQGFQIGETIKRVEEALTDEAIDLTIVFGDTNASLGGAIASRKNDIKLMHIEAGLRSGDMSMPEESNRIMIDHISDIRCCSSVVGEIKLKVEGLYNNYVTGDLMVELLKSNKIIETDIIEKVRPRGKYSLLTLHRKENADSKEALERILGAIGESGEKIIFPCHPRTRANIREFGISMPSNIKLIDPVGYMDMITLEKNAKKIITDSGGIQKEAYILKKQCITLRKSTEWLETVSEGWNVLVGADREALIHNLKSKFQNENKYTMSYDEEGIPSDNIVDIIKKEGTRWKQQ